MAEEVVIRDRPVKKTLFDQLVRGIQLIAETAFFMGCGAARIAWDGVARFINAAQDRAPLRLPFSLPAWTPPGKVKIPLLPIDDYNRMGAAEILKSLGTLSAPQLRVLKEFEENNKKRKTVLAAIDQRLSQSG